MHKYHIKIFVVNLISKIYKKKTSILYMRINVKIKIIKKSRIDKSKSIDAQLTHYKHLNCF